MEAQPSRSFIQAPATVPFIGFKNSTFANSIAVEKFRNLFYNIKNKEACGVYNQFITAAADLVTTYEQTRAGFLSIALEKNMMSDPYVKRALAFKALVANTNGPDDLIAMTEVRPFMLTASGLSDKSMQYLSETDKTNAIAELVEKFLKPAGTNYIDEVIYRYLLIKGDAVGGTMRNRIGALGQERLIRALISCMNVMGFDYKWLSNSSSIWQAKKDNDLGIEKDLKALYWNNGYEDRVLGFNLNIPIVSKNVDICLFNATISLYDNGKIVSMPQYTIMLGELKGGIDPAGADEHWKTANTALGRIRSAFHNADLPIKTSFIGAAIATAMSVEIYQQLSDGTLDNAANLTNLNQLTDYCNWILTV